MGTGSRGIRASRNAITPATKATAASHGRRGVHVQWNRLGRHPLLFQAQSPAAIRQISRRLKSWRMPCQTPASVMIRISTSLIYRRDRQAAPDALMRQGRVCAVQKGQPASFRVTDWRVMRFAGAETRRLSRLALMRQGRVCAALGTVFSGNRAILAHLRGARALHTEVVFHAASALATTLLVGGAGQGQGSRQQHAGYQEAHRGSSKDTL